MLFILLYIYYILFHLFIMLIYYYYYIIIPSILLYYIWYSYYYYTIPSSKEEWKERKREIYTYICLYVYVPTSNLYYYYETTDLYINHIYIYAIWYDMILLLLFERDMMRCFYYYWSADEDMRVRYYCLLLPSMICHYCLVHLLSETDLSMILCLLCSHMIYIRYYDNDLYKTIYEKERARKRAYAIFLYMIWYEKNHMLCSDWSIWYIHIIYIFYTYYYFVIITYIHPLYIYMSDIIHATSILLLRSFIVCHYYAIILLLFIIFIIIIHIIYYYYWLLYIIIHILFIIIYAMAFQRRAECYAIYMRRVYIRWHRSEHLCA